MAELGERPKRHAPKKLDPDFVTETIGFPGVKKDFVISKKATEEQDGTPPKKKSKLSLSKVKSPVLKSPPEVKKIELEPPGSIEDDLRLIAESISPDPSKVKVGVPEKRPRGRPPKSATENNKDLNGSPKFSPKLAKTKDHLKLSKPKLSPKVFKPKLASPKLNSSGDSPKVAKPRGRPPKTPTLVPKIENEVIQKPVETVPVETPQKVADESQDTAPETPNLDSPTNGNIAVKKKTERKRITSKTARELKKCDRGPCKDVQPSCFIQALDSCSKSGWTSRWYHMSRGEHFCNDCFEYYYRSNKPGSRLFTKWKHVWSTNGCSEAVVKGYMADQTLPYWLQCQKCGKWRQISRHLHITPEFIESYECGQNIQGFKQSDGAECEVTEDERVAETLTPTWLKSLTYAGYLMMSPAAPLMTEYYQDMVGLSAYYNSRQRGGPMPTTNNNSDSDLTSSESESEGSGDEAAPAQDQRRGLPYVRPPPPLTLPKWSDPFHRLGEETEGAMTFFPHLMNVLEGEEFPEFKHDQSTYLAIRNIAVTLWNMNCKTSVSVRQCMSHVVCRGLVRIRCVQLVPRVLRFLARHAYINTGLVRDIPAELKPKCAPQKHVVVIGAGAAGLAAARQLYNYGLKVTILEAKGSIGGRCVDNTSMGLCVGRGAQMINCSTNNPLSVLCHQLDMLMWPIEDRCELYQESGRVTDSVLDRRMDFHFNAMLDNVAEWRRDKALAGDTNLLEKIQHLHKQFVDETQLHFSEEELKLLQFHCSNLEFACGTSLDLVSAMSWDQNELYPQFSGSHCIVMSGYNKMLSALAKGLDVRCNTQVVSVNYTSDKVAVTTAGGTDFLCDKVIVSVPLAILKKGVIRFTPPLPEAKVKAIQSLGVGIVEKVALKFPTRFWAEKTKGADFFGHVPETEATRGMFGMFYDLKPQTELTPKTPAILVTYLCGNSIRQMSQKSDKEVINLCMATLRKLFTETKVPEPTQFFVTHWRSDPHIGMAYTCIPVGCPPRSFSDLAEIVEDKVHFAGEATNQQLPQSVTGAYLSGLREATLIMHELDDVDNEDAPESSSYVPVRARAAKRTIPGSILNTSLEDDEKHDHHRLSIREVKPSVKRLKQIRGKMPEKRGRKPNRMKQLAGKSLTAQKSSVDAVDKSNSDVKSPVKDVVISEVNNGAKAPESSSPTSEDTCEKENISQNVDCSSTNLKDSCIGGDENKGTKEDVDSSVDASGKSHTPEDHSCSDAQSSTPTNNTNDQTNVEESESHKEEKPKDTSTEEPMDISKEQSMDACPVESRDMNTGDAMETSPEESDETRTKDSDDSSSEHSKDKQSTNTNEEDSKNTTTVESGDTCTKASQDTSVEGFKDIHLEDTSIKESEDTSTNDSKDISSKDSEAINTEDSKDISTEGSQNTDTEESEDISTEVSKDTSTKASKDSSTEASEDTRTKEVSKDASTEASKDTSSKASKEISTEASDDSSPEASKDTSTEASKDTSTEASKDTSTEASKDTSTEDSKDTSTEDSKDTSTEVSKDTSTEASKDTSTEASKDTSTEDTCNKDSEDVSEAEPKEQIDQTTTNSEESQESCREELDDKMSNESVLSTHGDKDTKANSNDVCNAKDSSLNVNHTNNGQICNNLDTDAKLKCVSAKQISVAKLGDKLATEDIHASDNQVVPNGVESNGVEETTSTAQVSS